MMNLTVLPVVSMLMGRYQPPVITPGFTCEGPTPLFLKTPDVDLSLLPPDANLEKLLSLTWPRLDDNSTLPHPIRPLPDITASDIQEAFAFGVSMFNKQIKLEELLKNRGLSLKRNSSSYDHQVLNNMPRPTSKALSRTGHIVDDCTARIAKKYNLDRNQLNYLIQKLKAPKNCEDERMRPKREPCDPERRFRNQDGTCNNLRNPETGAAFTSFTRLVPSEFDDGVMTVRQAADGGDLPNARLVSTTVNFKPAGQKTCLNFLHMTFGQFLDHDLTETPMSKGVNGSTITCCSKEVQDNPDLLHPQCAPITIPAGDNFYSPYAATCMEFVRSVPADRCTLGPRQQLNQLTTYVDGGSVYGISLEEAAELRSFQGGLLKTQLTRDGVELLGPNMNLPGCNVPERSAEGEFCFKAGDNRVNEQMFMVMVTAVWAREHNRLAKRLAKINPHWDDERLFQEAKRILVAEIQQVVYNEYLPPVLSPKLMAAAGLNTGTDGQQTTDYNDRIDPAMTTDFATAAFRFGHSQVTDRIFEVAQNGRTTVEDFSTVFFNPFALYLPGAPERLVRGGLVQAAGNVDMGLSLSVSGKMFRRMKQFGLDLLALNVQRGRDHGIPGYVRYRMACGLKPVNNFDELKPDMEPQVLDNLKKAYKRVEDIDLFVGALSEKNVAGGNVGPTFACILADQFVRIKIGDRFWFEYKDSPGAFTVDQLRELQQVSFSRILCDNIRELNQVQRWSMEVISPFNPLLSCDSKCLPSLNLDLWKEKH
ncbi:peroxidase-like [Homarus americanus]|uniref:peroxidase-like n=1 Tax=Homarus americanus TaxID=6706 RepID=UPI001C4642AD|nr:peroxidase-like [Homarus americanus]